MLVFAMLGGGMIPLFQMPSWMATASNASPIKWGIYAIEGATWRALSWGELAPSLAILVGVGVFAYGIGAAILSCGLTMPSSARPATTPPSTHRQEDDHDDDGTNPW